ncbi:MAG: ATP-binding cassette domain-containing protein [Nitrososphaerales archaeon]
MPTVVSAENLMKKYGDLVAVDGINFSVEQGECFGFLGPNGAGKTTTIKMIQCVSPKTSGKLEVLGMDVDLYPKEIKRNLGVVPQENNLDPDFTVYENLMVYSRYFSIPKNEAKERIEKLLKFMQLEEKRDAIIERLSGGMKRRLILARALLNEPKILILDEPTVGLDPQARHLIWDRIRSLKKEGVTTILTTHYMEEASQLCDRLVIMDYGKILVEGRPEDLVREQIGTSILETKANPEVLSCLQKMKQEFEIVGDTIHIFTDSPSDLMFNLMGQCRLSQTTVRSATLEDVFLKLTGRALRE